MRSAKALYITAAVVIASVLIVAFAPVVPYRLSVATPGGPKYDMNGYLACENTYVAGRLVNMTSPAFQRCIAQYLIPSINMTGYGSLSYSLLGVGRHPFPDLLTVGEKGFNVILHMSGSKIVAAEEVPQTDVIYNPPGITINNLSLSLGFLGRGNITISVTNRSGQTMANQVVFISVPGDSGNITDESGIQWMFSVVGNFCLVDGRLVNVTSGATCIATGQPIIQVAPNSAFRYSVEVRGTLGAHYFITKQTFSYSSPYIDQAWMTEFINLVNSARNGPPLTESHGLDTFAAQRFKTAVTQPDISDYGLSNDIASFFGANATSKGIVELLFFPNVASPYTYESTVQGFAPGHWATLTNLNYTHYGFYVGKGAYEVLDLPCPITEIPRAGINITQFFASKGCSVTVEQTTWLVIILSS
jgi:hypothetical protein